MKENKDMTKQPVTLADDELEMVSGGNGQYAIPSDTFLEKP